MSRESKIQYNPALSVKENAKRNGVSEAAIRYHIKVNEIDRRFDRKQSVIEDCRKYLKKHPDATWDELQKKTGHSLSTMRKYREYITTEKELTDFDNRKAEKRQDKQAEIKRKQFAYLDTIPKDVILEYLTKKEEREQNETVETIKRVEEVKILGDIPFKPFEEFHIPVSECVQFHSKALPENKVLSNHYECIVTFRGVEFYGLEQMYAALNYSDSPSIVKQIMNCTSGKAAKSLCNKKYADKRDWDFEEKRYRIIALCHLFKYLSVKEFRDRLRETYPQTLVECPNGKDYHFGMVQNLETNIFEGNNCSGRTLMAVRDMMKAREDYEIGYNEALVGKEFSEAEKEEVREALYGDIRHTFENDKQVLKDSKPLFTILEKDGISKKRERKPKPFIAPSIDRETKCLVMDFDDTLFDTSADDAYRKCEGKKDMDRAMEMIPQYRLYDGWREVIEWTQTNGVKIAILSGASGKLIEKAVQHFKIPCAAIVGYQPYIEKPNTILGNMLQERLNIRHEQIIYVGDSYLDDIQARASQFRFLGAIWHTNHKDYFTEKRIRTIINPIELIPIMVEFGWKKIKATMGQHKNNPRAQYYKEHPKEAIEDRKKQPTPQVNNDKVAEIEENGIYRFEKGAGVVQISRMSSLFSHKEMIEYEKYCKPSLRVGECFLDALSVAEFFKKDGYDIKIAEGYYTIPSKNNARDTHRFCKIGEKYFDANLERFVGYDVFSNQFIHTEVREYDTETLWAFVRKCSEKSGQLTFCSSLDGIRYKGGVNPVYELKIDDDFHLVDAKPYNNQT